MQKIFRAILLLYFTLNGVYCIGQGSVGVRPNPIIRHDTKFIHEDFIYRNIDTSLYDFHRYNSVFRAEYPAIILGNPGQKYHSIFFVPKYGSGFRSGQNLLDLYFKDIGDVRYFDTKTPFTDLTLIVGQKEEISVHGVHTQNISAQFNFGIDYERNASKGAYNRNRGTVQNLILHSWYRNKSNAYHLMPSLSLNKAILEENGGLAIDNIFTTNAVSGRLKENIEVNLNNAKNARSIKTLELQQFILPSLFKNKKDSTFVDSSQLYEKLRIGFSTKLTKNNFSYTDPIDNANYYQDFFYNPTETIDSFKLRQFDQEVSVNNVFFTGHFKQAISASVQYQLTNYQQYELNRNIHDASVFLSWHFNPDFKQAFSNKLSFKAHFTPGFIGDFDFHNDLRIQLNKFMSLNWIARINNRTPSIKEQVWRSNHFYYYNYFQKENIITNTILFHCSHGDINAELSHHAINNFIYSGENILFEQSPELLHVVTFKANKLFDFKNIGLFSEVISQYNSNNEILNVPLFYFRQSVYYKGGFFSGKVNANLGLDIWYNTNYQIYDYNPALAVFFVQNTQTQKYIPVIDAFFDIQINRARVFLQMQNVAQGLGQKGYYVAINHPGQDRAFKAGVRWQFYD